MKQDKDEHVRNDSTSDTSTRAPLTAGEIAEADADAPSGDPDTTSTSTAAAEPGPSREEVRAARREKAQATARRVGASTSWFRARLAQVVWLVALACAVVLGVGALLTALSANPDNAIVSWVLARAGQLDGPFIDIFTFTGENAQTKQTLVGWGLAAIAFLVVGRVAERVIKP